MATLTVYPQAGSGSGNVSCDGYTSQLSYSWPDDGRGTGWAHNETAVALFVSVYCTYHGGKSYHIQRSFISFDTSLGENNVITSATLSVFGRAYSKQTTAPDCTGGINVYSSEQPYAYELPAYGQIEVGSVPFSTTKTYTNSGQYNDFVLNSAGIAAINLTGVTKFSLRETDFDVAGNTPWGSTGFAFFSADNLSNPPKLTIEYTYISPTSIYTETGAGGVECGGYAVVPRGRIIYVETSIGGVKCRGVASLSTLITYSSSTSCYQTHKNVLTYDEIIDMLYQQPVNPTCTIVKVLPNGGTVLLGNIRPVEELVIQYNTATITVP